MLILSSKGFNHTNTSVSTKIGGVALAVSEEIYSDHQGEVKISDLPIFQLLKAFKLQQYALVLQFFDDFLNQRLAELGYGEEIYKLALLTEKQRQDIIGQLKVLPGHNAKLLYPKKALAEQLKQFTPGGSQAITATDKKPKRITSAYKPRMNIHSTTSKSLLQQYENLDPLTKQAFNETFLANLESAKYSIGQLMSQHVNKEDSKNAINHIFPPVSYLGYGNRVLEQVKQDDNYNKEIEGLLRKYTANSQYKNFNNKDALDKRTGLQQASDLKQGMAQAMKDIDQINKHLEQFIKPQSAQSQFNQMIQQQNQVQQDLPPPRNEIHSKQSDQRPATKQSVQTKNYEVFKDDQDKSRITILNDNDKSIDDVVPEDDEMPTQSDISLSDTQINEALNILNDPIALSMAVKEQYNIAQKQNQNSQSTQQLITQPGEDASFMNPLSAGDDSKLNVTTKFYKKQQVYEEPPTHRRPMSPLIEKEERDRLWNCGQSLNSKQVTSALGYLDLKQICYCLANALMKHIEFSQGYYFIDDLQEHLKNTSQLDSQMNFGFTYNIQDQLKIDLELARQKKAEKEQQQKKEFEELKKKMQLESTAQNQKKIQTNVKEYEEVKRPVKQEVQQQKALNQDLVEDDIQDETEIIKDDEQDIKDEVEESDYIQDYYEDVSEKRSDGQQQQNHEEHGEGDEDIDFDYSQTHLEDFLKSQNQSTLIKGSNIQSSQLLNTFLSSYSKMKSGASFRDSHMVNQITSKNMMASKMNPIDENLEQSESEKSDTRTRKIEQSDSEDDGFGRSHEHVDLAKVDVKSNPSPRKQSKPILSKSEVEQVRKKQDEEEKKHQSKMVNEIKIDVKTKQGFKDLLRFQMRIFDQNYDFERDQLVGGESVYMGNPTIEELYYYCKYVIISGRMEKEIPILCLNYIERFLTKTGVLMNHANWKRLTLISLTLASKIWDDDSLENVHFPQVMPDITLKEIASLEKIFLQLIDFDLIIKGGEYAKYYFILKHFAEKFNSTLPMGPLTVEQMSDLQNNTVKAESDLRERYNMKLSLKKTI